MFFDFYRYPTEMLLNFYRYPTEMLLNFYWLDRKQNCSLSYEYKIMLQKIILL